MIPAGSSPAHIGDEIYPFYELLDKDLRRIDLTDGSVEDWLEVLGEPSLTATDFVWGFQSDPGEYDPWTVDFRIWLAWNQSTSTLWVAMERFDAVYINRYDGYDPYMMEFWDSSIVLMVDGDHSGGRYAGWFEETRGWDVHEAFEYMDQKHQRQAQEWVAIAETPDGEPLFHPGLSEWVAREPYAASGGGVIGGIGGRAAVTVTELMVTSFDDLIYNDEDVSEASRFYLGKTIGFDIRTRGPGSVFISLTGRKEARFLADLFVDGLLVGAGESLYGGSAVEPSSWGRIKAALDAR